MSERVPSPRRWPDSGGEAAGNARRGSDGVHHAESMGPIDNVIGRLGDLIREETAALRAGAHGDIAGLSARKTRIAFELGRAIDIHGAAAVDAATAAELAELHEMLEANRSVLKLHITAVREVASIITEALREAEWDGTYTEIGPKRWMRS